MAGVAVAFLGQVGGGGTYLGRVGRVGQVGQVGRRDSASEGCHSASPRSRLAEPKTGGLRGTPYFSTLVVAQAHVSATARVDYYIADSFPAGLRGRLPPPTRGPGWSSGFALDQGLAEWHPFGCSRGCLWRGYLSRTSRTSRTIRTGRTPRWMGASWASDSSDLSDLSDSSDKAPPPVRLVREGTFPPVWFGFRGLGKKGYLCSEGRGVFWIGNH